MKEVIEKLKELIEMLEEKPELPEKHRKFAAYWDEIGRPELEATCKNMSGWMSIIPDWSENLDYRIKDDPHWRLRLKWVDSDKILPVEKSDYYSEKWVKDNDPVFDSFFRYREAIPWYAHEITADNPMLLQYSGQIDDFVQLWRRRPVDYYDYRPLTDAEIDALKRGF